jgi:hypothetical protein
MAATPYRTWTLGRRLKLHVNRADPDAWPVWMIYPLHRGERPGVLITLGYRRFEFRW